MIAYDIPQHWQTLKLRQILRPYSEKNHPELPLLSVVREKGVIVRNTESKEENHNYIPEDLSGYKRVKAGQFAMNKMKAWQGSYGISKYEGIVSPAYFVFDVITGMNLDFFNLAIRSKVYVSFFGRASDGIRVGQWDLSIDRMKEIPFFVPPREEQDQIVRFLDWKVSEINRLINIKHKEIARLEELKKIAIHEAVTKGLNPDADMKDSGFDFIGEIPLHWRLIKLKWLLSSVLQYGANASGVEFRENLPRYIRITDITLDNKLKDDGKLSLSTEDATPCILHDKDILFARSGATVGKSFIYREEYGLAAFAGYLIRAQVNPSKANADFIYMVTLSKYYELWKNRIFIQATIQNISAEKYNNLPVPLPPIEEQVRIVEFVKHKIVQIEAAIENEKMQIQALHEFKTRLISDVVTGKIDVRGIEIPEYEYTAEEADTDSEAEAEDLDEGGEEI